MREAHRLQESAEGADVAHDALCLDLLLQVEAGVRVEHLLRSWSAGHQGQQTDLQSSVQAEARRFGSEEWMHGAVEGSAPEKIDAAPAELPRAGTGEREAPSVRRLENRVHDGQQFGDSLHLVDDDVGSVGLGGDYLAEPFRPGTERAVERRFEQIQMERLGKLLQDPGRLARSSRARRGRNSRPGACRNAVLASYWDAKRRQCSRFATQYDGGAAVGEGLSGCRAPVAGSAPGVPRGRARSSPGGG